MRRSVLNIDSSVFFFFERDTAEAFLQHKINQMHPFNQKSILYLAFTFLSICSSCFAQMQISGRVLDPDKQPIVGANVYLEGTYDGASSDEEGFFLFQTTESGMQTLVVSMLGYESRYEAGDVTFFKDFEIVLLPSVNALNGVTLTAGTFEAGDNSKVSVLKPLDIVTTAGAAGDFVAALQTLPGTTPVAEDGRLFVRGGRAEETQVFIDGMRVFQPFNATANNIPTRGRFSPFLFKGITFSTGGYSAEYGQALSSVLLLNTTDLADQTKTDISVMSVGAGLAQTVLWGEQSLSVNASYINLKPYEALLPSTQGIRWTKPYESFSGEAVFRSLGDQGIFKLYGSFNRARLSLEQEDINFEDFVPFELKNDNVYVNSTYKYFLGTGWSFATGASVSYDTNTIGITAGRVRTQEVASHFKATLSHQPSNRFQFRTGAEVFITDYQESFESSMEEVPLQEGMIQDKLPSVFAESDLYFSQSLALKAGLRYEYSELLEKGFFMPRASLALKIGEQGQLSAAYGLFYQKPLQQVALYGSNLQSQQAHHYLLNYQFLVSGKTFRAELFRKNYSGLARFDTQLVQANSNFSFEGEGYAQGVDVFWRDNKSVKNLEYWISYSYLDTQRIADNFPAAAQPNFAPRHNGSVVTKLWVNALKSQLGLSYSWASGRPYENPNLPGFQESTTPDFHNLSFNWAYLLDQQKILYFSVNNILGINNVNNYQYSNTPDSNGFFDRRAIRPAADSFFFVGFFWTISDDNSSNQLDNL